VRPSSCREHSSQRGISAVEILVGLALGLALLVGVASLVVGSRQTSRVERNLIEMQATGRAAIGLMSREIRKAGFRNNREFVLKDIFPAAAAPFTTATAVVAAQNAGTELLIRYQGGGDGWTADCLGNATPDGHDLWETLWLQGGALRCRARNLTLNTDQTLALIPSIEAMALTYGIDNDADGFADGYVAAAAVVDWSRVVSVNVQVRVLSSEDSLADAPQPFVGFDGVAVTPNDRRLRRNYSTVVALRNLLP
jgi:type IV pilus assembly protein PilW